MDPCTSNIRRTRSTARLALIPLALAWLACDDERAPGPSDDLPEVPAPMVAACQPGEAPIDVFCLHECPADVDVVVAGVQLECTVTEVATDAAGATSSADVPPCSAPGVLPAGASACFDVHVDDALPDACANDGWIAELAITRAPGAATGCRIEATCARSSTAAFDCPNLPVECGDGWCGGGETCRDCPADCGSCGDYSSCNETSECIGATPHCVALDVFGDGAICTAPCDATNACPGFSGTGAAGRCMDGACVLSCVGDRDCPAGTTCEDLGPIAPGPTTYCLP